MAEFHLHGQIIKRSQGRSAVNAAAYRAGEALYDKRLDRTFDYTGKHDVEESIILGPDHAPEWMFDRQMLWNTVEDAERHKRAQLAREFDIALPFEFVEENPAAAKEALKGWAGDMFVANGLMVDINFHNMGGNNPHAHVMTTMRRVHSQAFEFQEESRYAFEDTKARDQNDWGYMDHWRETWADYANAAMADHGIDARIDHRTLIEQDIDREPGIHLGPVANAMEARGEPTGRWLKNEMIWFDNEEPWFEENRRYVAFLDSEAAIERQRPKEEAVRQEAERKENEAAAAVVARADEFADLKRRLDQAPEGILGDYAIRFYNVAERLKAEARAMAARRAPGLHSLAERLHAARPSTQVAKERLAGAAKRLDQGIKRVLAGRAEWLELAATNLERARPAFAIALVRGRSRAAAAAEDLRMRANSLAAAISRTSASTSARWAERLSSAVLNAATILKGASWRLGGRGRFIEPDERSAQAGVKAPPPASEVTQGQQHERHHFEHWGAVLDWARSLLASLQRTRAVRSAKAAAKAAEALEAALNRNLQLAEAAIRARVDHSAPAIEQHFVSEWIRTMRATKGSLEVRYREADRVALRGYALRMNRHPQIGELDRELIRLSPFAGGVDLSARDAPPELPEGMKTDLGRQALYTRHVLWISQELRADREVSEHLRQLLRRSGEEDSSPVSHAARGRQTSRFTGKAGFEMGDE